MAAAERSKAARCTGFSVGLMFLSVPSQIGLQGHPQMPAARKRSTYGCRLGSAYLCWNRNAPGHQHAINRGLSTDNIRRMAVDIPSRSVPSRLQPADFTSARVGSDYSFRERAPATIVGSSRPSAITTA
jgi:hypothetical protein